MKFRDLTSEDLFAMTNIISKLGINEFKNIMNEMTAKKEGGTTVVSVSFDVIAVIVSNLPKAEKEIFAFLASIAVDTKEEDLRKMKASDFINAIGSFVKSDDFKDFLKALGISL